MQRGLQSPESHARPTGLHGQSAVVDDLVHAPWWHEDKVSNFLFRDVHVERRLGEFIEGRDMCLPVEFLSEHLLKVLGCLGCVSRFGHKPERGSPVLGEAHEVVTRGGTDILVSRRIRVANAEVAHKRLHRFLLCAEDSLSTYTRSQNK